MECGDLHIHASMDGQELHAVANPPDSDKHDEPTAFFFVIFGLVYEALAASSAESTSAVSARQALVIAALQTLKSLVRPEYSGKAIIEPMIFEEFISLCYRIAMTESARVQVYLLEMLSVFAASQSQNLA
jgi:HEAT repeat-containing protein 5